MRTTASTAADESPYIGYAATADKLDEILSVESMTRPGIAGQDRKGR